MKTNLLTRQIKAVEKTFKYTKMSYEKGYKEHRWKASECSLCKTFLHRQKCESCPLSCFETRFHAGCLAFAFREYSSVNFIPLEEVAGFLKSLLISLEEL